MISFDLRQSFINKLRSLDKLYRGKDSYLDGYLSNLIDHLPYYVDIYIKILETARKQTDKRKEEITIVDVGAGTGLLGLFAKHCGFKKVFSNDTLHQCIETSNYLSEKLGLPLDGFICGDIEKVVEQLSLNREHGSIAMVGCDMIEHVYDLKHYINQATSIKSLDALVFTTASNPKNILKRIKLIHYQWKDEQKEFIHIRKQIIKDHVKLSEREIEILSKRTRGLQKKDILKAVDDYLETKKVPSPNDLFNTCDPMTGSWTERILPISDYRTIFNENGIKLEVAAGHYDSEKSGWRTIMNNLIPYTGIGLAPYIILSGKRSIDR